MDGDAVWTKAVCLQRQTPIPPMLFLISSLEVLVGRDYVIQCLKL